MKNQITHIQVAFSSAAACDSLREILTDLQIGEIDDTTAAPVMQQILREVAHLYPSLPSDQQAVIKESQSYLN
jgi:hypothetical protein